MIDNDIAQLQHQIIDRVTKVADIRLLNKVSSLLRTTNIENIAKLAFKKDYDGAKFIDRLSKIVIGLDLPISEKVKFLREFGSNNYINADALFDNSGTIKSMEDWWNGTGMATTMFKLMINDPELIGKFAGEAGPGEVAIAVFHRDITVGLDPKNGYDLKYNSDEIEVKTKASEKSSSGGGRWTAMNEYPLLTYAYSPGSVLDPELLPDTVSLSSQGIKHIGLTAVLSDPQYLKNPDKPLTQEEQRQIFIQILKMSYAKASDKIINNVAASYPNPTALSVAPAAFDSYKNKQEFTSMLLIKVSSRTIHTMHFTEVAPVLGQFKLGTLYVKGQQRGMDLQATIR